MPERPEAEALPEARLPYLECIEAVNQGDERTNYLGYPPLNLTSLSRLLRCNPLSTPDLIERDAKGIALNPDTAMATG